MRRVYGALFTFALIAFVVLAGVQSANAQIFNGQVGITLSCNSSGSGGTIRLTWNNVNNGGDTLFVYRNTKDAQPYPTVTADGTTWTPVADFSGNDRMLSPSSNSSPYYDNISDDWKVGDLVYFYMYEKHEGGGGGYTAGLIPVTFGSGGSGCLPSTRTTIDNSPVVVFPVKNEFDPYVSLTASVRDAGSGTLVTTGTLTFEIWDLSTSPYQTMVGQSQTISVVNGAASATISYKGFTPDHAYRAFAKYTDASKTYGPSEGNALVAVGTRPTSLAASPATATYGGQVTLTATLKDAGSSTPSPLSGKTVAFVLNTIAVCGTSATPACPQTNSLGVATITVSLPLVIHGGDYGTGVYAKFAGDSVYAASDASADLNVSPIAPNVVVTSSAAACEAPYPEVPCSHFNDAVTFTATVSSTLTGGTVPQGKVSFYDGGSCDHPPATSLAADVSLDVSGVASSGQITSLAIGSHTILACYSGDETYDANSGTVTQNIYEPTTTAITAPGVTYGNDGTITVNVYQLDSSQPLPTGTVSLTIALGTTTVGTASKSLVVDTVNKTSSAVFTKTDIPALEKPAAHTYDLTAAYTHDSSSPYFIDSHTSGTQLVVSAATLTVTADPQSVTYGGDIPSPLTYKITGFQNGDNESVVNPKPSCTTTATSTSSANSYDITCSGGSAANYSFSYVNGTLTIHPRAITVKADDKTITYGEASPAFSYTITSGSLVGTDSLGDPTFKFDNSTTVPTAHGTYVITVTALANSNYAITTESGTYTIHQRPITVKVDNKQIIYGDPPGDFSYEVISGSLVGSDSLGTPTYKFGDSTTVPTAHGTYSVTATDFPNANYQVTVEPGTFVIDLRPIGVKADDKTITYGATSPTFSYTITVGSLVNSDSLGTPTYLLNGSETVPTARGAYRITVTGLTNPNYRIMTLPGTFTIEPAKITITAADVTVVYGGTMPTLTATISGDGAAVAAADGITATAHSLVNSKMPVANSPYLDVLEAGFNDPNHKIGNYEPTFVNGKLTITPATPVIKVTGGTWVYDGNEHPASATATGIDAETVAGHFTFEYSPGGTQPPVNYLPVAYTAIATFTSTDPNYGPAAGQGLITITKASSSVKVTCPSTALPYNGSLQTPCSATVTGTNLNLSLVGDELDYENNLNAGTATASVTFGGDINHTGSSGSATFTISPVAVTATAGSISGTYTGSPQTVPACELIGTFLGDLKCTNSPASVTDAGKGEVIPVVTGTGLSNFTVSKNNGQWSMAQVDSKVAISCEAGQVYTGAPHTPCTATVTGVNLNQPVTVTYSNNINAGEATASAVFDGDTNHTASDATTKFTIAKASSTTTVAGGSFEYNGSAHPATVSVTGAGGLSLTPSASYSGTCTSAPITVAEGTNCTASYNYGGDANHESSNGSAKITITKAPVKVVVSPLTTTYNGLPHAVPMSVTPTSAASVVVLTYTSASPTYNSTNAPTDAGTYAATASLKDPANYEFSGDSTLSGTLIIDKASSTTTVTGGSFPYDGLAHAATVSVTGAGGLSLTPSPTYSDTCSSAPTTVAEGTNCTASYTYDGDANHTGSQDSAKVIITKAPSIVTVTFNDAAPYVYKGSAFTATAEATGIGGLKAPLDVTYTGQCTNVSTTGCTASATYGGDANHTGNTGSATITIVQRPTELTWGFSGGSVQYSDFLPLNINVTSGIVVKGTVHVIFTGSTNGSYDFYVSTPKNVAGTAIMLAPGTYQLGATFTPDDGTNVAASSTTTQTLNVTQEDARIMYTGDLYVGVGTLTSGTVHLSATIRDISNPMFSKEPAYDLYPGDISNAIVTFKNQETGATICSKPVTLFSTSEKTTGMVECSFPDNIGPTGANTYPIKISVSNYYTRESSEDSVVVTLAQGGAGMITGGGYVVLDNTATGLVHPAADTKNNFGFNVKYNKSGQNLQGNINTIVRSAVDVQNQACSISHPGHDVCVYQLKGNQMASLSVSQLVGNKMVAGCTGATPTSPCYATFTGKANVQDITNPNLAIAVDNSGNATLQATMIDYGSGSNAPPDTISYTVSNSYGLWFQTTTAGFQKPLAGGNIVVH